MRACRFGGQQAERTTRIRADNGVVEQFAVSGVRQTHLPEDGVRQEADLLAHVVRP